MHKSLRLGKLLVLPYDSYSNYVNLPSNILERISKMKNQHLPYHFELKTSYDMSIYVGVKEFTAPDDCIEVPTWLATHLAEDYLMVTFLKNIVKGEYIKIQPQSKTFFDIPESDKILEAALSNYCLLHLNQIIEVKLLDNVHKIKILECKIKLDDPNEELIEITNVDLKVDIDNMFEEEQKQEELIKKQEVINKKQEVINKKQEEIKIKKQEEIKIKKQEDDFASIIPEIEKKLDISGEKLGGTTTDDLRKARLKYYEK